MSNTEGLRLSKPSPARAGDPQPEDPKDPKTPLEDDDSASESTKKKDQHMTEDEHKAAVAAAEQSARTEATTQANARFAAVLASEHYAGREKLAANLLGNEKMSADEIVTALALADKIEPKAEEDPDAAARAAMADAIGETGNSGIETTGANAGQTDTKAKADAVWTRAWGLKEGAK